MLRLTRASLLAAALLALSATSAYAAPVPHYTAVDLGTLGGPNAYFNLPGRTISENGIVVGSAETPDLNPFTQECEGCHAVHAFQWRDGTMTDLGTLGGYGAGLFELNGAGVGAGYSETGVLDPATDFPEAHAVESNRGRLIDLGTLGGNESWASAVNDRGEIAGFASNATPDPHAQAVAELGLAAYPSATEWHAVIWRHEKIHDLGTLGGSDSFGGLLNQHGQIAGVSFTSSGALDPFLWHHGTMHDLGSLGGTRSMVNWLNDRGELAGSSNLAGDTTAHPFLWTGTRMLDLGTLGGDAGSAHWVNEAGSVVGSADLPGSAVHHGFLWRHGRISDLPPAAEAPCSNANMVNDRGEAVGNATDCRGNELAAMLWRRRAAFDLNHLIDSSSVHLFTAEYANDRGEIIAGATLPNGDSHLALLVPARASAQSARRGHRH